jgi:hypothetical protein
MYIISLILDVLLFLHAFRPYYHNSHNTMCLFTNGCSLGAPWESLPIVLLATTFLYTFGLGVYRLTLHPLAKFPGPKLAAFTGWYETYFEIFGGHGNTIYFKIQRWHEKYGPIIRINPDELHVSDPDFFDTLYAGGGARRDKYPPAAAVQSTPESIFGTVGHDAHRKRRGAISTFFSKKSVADHESLIHSKVELLCDIFEKTMRTGEAINIRVPLLAYTTDFYCAHALSDSVDMNLLSDMGKAEIWRNNVTGLTHLVPIVRQFPWVLPIAVELPMWLLKLVSADAGRLVQLLRVRLHKSYSLHFS